MRAESKNHARWMRRGPQAALLLMLCWCGARGAGAQTAAATVLDRVVAVVNNQAILQSDLEDEMRLSILEPRFNSRGPETPQAALQRLISRTLIQQQIRQEDAQAAEAGPEEVAERLSELRHTLPACVHLKCSTDEGWTEFLTRYGLTQAEVEGYLLRRIEILRFIERRFRQGIQIDDTEVTAYYRDTLTPQYAKGEAVPPLAQVAPRIEEILLQQKVSALFSDWLENLRKQGEVEVLDPALETAEAPRRGATGR